MRKTKIICTLGPATESREIIQKLIEEGAEIFRLNMSHSSHEWVRTIVPRIREISRELDRHTAILLDTQGPEIRTGDLPSPISLKPGDPFEFTVRGEQSTLANSTSVNYDDFADDLAIGDIILVDNGLIRMRVREKSSNRLHCETLTECIIGSRRHINLPGIPINLPPLTDKDLRDIAMGAEVGMDMIALSFCREASDLEALHKALARHNCKARVIAKIEHQLAVKNLTAIIKKSDIIMIARGDLGIECPMEDLPIIQRDIVKECLRSAKPVIVATHMMESMTNNPLPTRAEVTDAATAVYEQADCVMLSGETSIGKYPVECVTILDRIARRIERSENAGYSKDSENEDPRQKTVRAAVLLADSFPNAKLVVFTRRGLMANYTSNLRPTAPIYAFTFSLEVCRKLLINWGTIVESISFDVNPNRMIEIAESYLLSHGLAESGDRLIIISDILAVDKRSDSIHVRLVE